MLELCSKSEFADFVRDFSLRVEMDIGADSVVMRYVNRDGIVCASSKVDLRSGVESDWKIVVEVIEKPKQRQPRKSPRTGQPIPADSVLLDDFFSGLSVKEICKKYGISITPVYKALHKTPEFKKERRKDSKLFGRSQEIIDMYLSGQSVIKIAQQFGVSWQRISQILIPAGYSKRVSKNLTKDIVESYLSGTSINEIAQRYGLSSPAVNKRIIRHRDRKRP